jgi:hypothetical protein
MSHIVRLPKSFPIRGVARRSPVRVAKGATSLKAAYERVGKAVGLPARDVAECYRLTKRHITPPNYTKKHHDAMWMLGLSERTLEEHIRRLIMDANALQPLVDGRPRFKYQHHWTSINSGSGWPDDVLIDRKWNRVYFWENKRETESPRDDQQEWLDDLAACATGSPGLVVLGTIRPSNYSVLVDIVGLSPEPGQAHRAEQDGQDQQRERVGQVDVD